MKSADELQLAHDTLAGIVTGEVRLPSLDRRARERLHAALDVLCWVMEHDHNVAFAENLAKLRKEIGKAGYVMVAGQGNLN